MSGLDLGPGFHAITMDEYRFGPCNVPELSASIAKLINSRSVAHAWDAHPKGGRHFGAQSGAMKNGTVLDSLLLGGDAELIESPHDEYRSNAAKEWRDRAIESGKTPVKAKELEAARNAAEKIKERLAREGVVLDGVNQQTAVWDDNGVRCKARFDHWKPDALTILDLKIVDNAHPESVTRKVVDYGYDIQAAAYTRAVETLIPEAAGRVKFLFLFCESEAPYEILVRPLAATMRALGEFRWSRAVAAWGEALKTRHFPGYYGLENGIEAKPHHLAMMDEALAGGSDGISF